MLLLLLLLFSSKNYLYAIQLKGTEGAKAWPVLRLVKLELKGSVQLTSKVKICIYIYIYIYIYIDQLQRSLEPTVHLCP